MGHLDTFFGETSLGSSAHFLSEFSVFLILSCVISLIIWIILLIIWILTPYRYLICRYFLPFPFCLVDGSLCCAEAFLICMYLCACVPACTCVLLCMCICGRGRGLYRSKIARALILQARQTFRDMRKPKTTGNSSWI